MLEAFILGIGGNIQNQHSKNQGKHNPNKLKYFSMRGDVPKVNCGIFVRGKCYGKYQKVCME